MSLKKKIKKKNQNFDFESLYKMYPRREGKKRGMDKLNIHIKTEEDFIKFRSAVYNYVRLCQKENRPSAYIKHWCTFVNNWTDYLEDLEPAIESTNITQMQRVLSGEL